MSKVWIALFSQTGSELNEIKNRLNYEPDYICTNNISDPMPLIEADVKGTHDFLMKQIKTISELHKNEPILITLHGYLHIIPKEIIDLSNVEIYNGHPGDIVRYPELIGKDPQKKAFEAKHSTAGTILHRVTEDLDQGPILDREVIQVDPYWTEYGLTSELKNTSIRMWTRFLMNKLDCI